VPSLYQVGEQVLKALLINRFSGLPIYLPVEGKQKNLSK
jgi:hypothetical protein